MKIKLHKALDLLAGAGAVIINNHEGKPNVIPNFTEDGIDLSWESVRLKWDCSIKLDDNLSVEIENSTMALIDEDGKIVELKLLFPTNLPSFCQDCDIVE